MKNFDTYVDVLREISQTLKSENLDNKQLQSQILILKELNKDLIEGTNELCSMTDGERRVIQRLMHYIYSLLPERDQLIMELGQYSATEKLYYQCCPSEIVNTREVKEDVNV